LEALLGYCVHRKRWGRLQELFSKALTLPEAERSAWLARACNDDAELLGEVTELLRAEAMPGVLDTPP
jgi:hypothetical protein